jgi:hypothetical protein
VLEIHIKPLGPAVSLRISDARVRLGLRRVDETLEQLLHLLLLAVEMLLVALQALDELLAIGEPPPAAPVSV